MKIECIPVGELQANCYIVTKNSKTIIIDPGDEELKIEKYLFDKNVVGIFLTHAHFDHIGALSYFEKKYQLKHNENINFFDCKAIPTPGHSKDSISFYFPEEKVMFTGDFIFKRTIGRMDLPGGSIKEMQESLIKIKEYPDDITIYPGHGEKTNLGTEKYFFDYYFQ